MKMFLLNQYILQAAKQHGDAATLRQTISQLESQIKQLTSQITQLKSDVSHSKEENDLLQITVERLTEENVEFKTLACAVRNFI